jgi:DNA-binding CsgD family transcriptional regulator
VSVWPFVGRQHEVRAIVSALEIGSVALLGPPGIGKTRLALAVQEEIETQHRATAHLAAIATDRTIPLLALRPLLGDHSTGDLTSVIHASLGLGTQRPGPGDPVIFLDDAHSLDDQSAAILHQVLLAQRARLVLTVRSDVLLPSAVSAMLRSDRLRRMPVAALPADTANVLLAAALDGPVDGRSATRLLAASQGNLVMLRELVTGAADSGVLARRHGLWTLSGPLSATLVLTDLVASRTAFLSPEEQLALELVVVGGALPIDLLVTATSMATIESLERQLLLIVRDLHGGSSTKSLDANKNGTVPVDTSRTIIDVAHPLYREVLAGQMGKLARVRCHRQLAELATNQRVVSEGVRNGHNRRGPLAPHGAPFTPEDPNELLRGHPAHPSQQLQLAIWRLLGGVSLPADETLAAARHAASLNDGELAADLAIASYEAEPTLEAAILACWTLSTSGRQGQAEAFAEAAQQQLTTGQATALLALRRAEERWWWAHDTEGAQRILHETAATLDAQWADLLTCQIGVFEALNGHAKQATAFGERFIGSPSLWVRRTASIALGFGYALSDRVDEALTQADHGYQEALNDPATDLSGDPAIHIVCRLFAGVYGTDTRQMLALAELVYGVAVHQPGRQASGWSSLLLGMTQLVRGRPLAAARSGTEAELLWSDSQVPGIARWSATLVALAQLDLGDINAAEEATIRMQSYESTGFTFGEPVECRVLARIAHAKGRSDQAGELLVTGALRALDNGAVVNASDCLEELLRIGALDQASLVAASLPLPHGPVTDLRCRLLNALRTDDPEETGQIALEFATMGRDLASAEIWAWASELHKQRKNLVSAGTCVKNANDLLRLCEGASLEILRDAKDFSTGPLSVREFEIARLAAQELSNKSIADRLIISERTVESHLYRVFAKLGISTREAIAAQISAFHIEAG